MATALATGAAGPLRLVARTDVVELGRWRAAWVRPCRVEAPGAAAVPVRDPGRAAQVALLAAGAIAGLLLAAGAHEPRRGGDDGTPRRG